MPERQAQATCQCNQNISCSLQQCRQQLPRADDCTSLSGHVLSRQSAGPSGEFRPDGVRATLWCAALHARLFPRSMPWSKDNILLLWGLLPRGCIVHSCTGRTSG